MKTYINSKDFCFIQIGANDGVQFDDLYEFVTQYKCRGIVIEPLKECFKKLEQNYSKNPNITPVNCAIHKDKEKVTMYHVDPEKFKLLPRWVQGIGSFDPDFHKINKNVIPSDYIITEEVKCQHLMDIIRESKFDEVNLLQIDAEGYDGEIVKMIDFDLIKPKLIIYEHANLKKEEQQEIKELLKANGYKLSSSSKIHKECDIVAFLSP